MDHRTIVDAEELLLSALVAATPEGAPGRAEVRCELEERALLRYLMRRNEERLADALFRESSGPFTFALGWDAPSVPVSIGELRRAVVRASLIKRASNENFTRALSLLSGIRDPS